MALTPKIVLQIMLMAITVINFKERFWNKVEKTDYCWNWTAGVQKDGYGYFDITIKKKRTRYPAHRVGWFIKYGEWPKLFALHKCDNRRCVNPDHLFEGTQKDNVQDAINKGRNHPWKTSPRTKKGSIPPNRITTFEIAQKIREEYKGGQISQRELGRRYKLRYTIIWGIVNDKIYLN